MPASIVDIVILGSGPIAASSAYFLMQNRPPNSRVLLITEEPLAVDTRHTATYRYAGGSVRWYWDDVQKQQATRVTAEFIKELLARGVDLAALEDRYLFLHRGVSVPSLNLSGAKLVEYLLTEAQQQGLEIRRKTSVINLVAEKNSVQIVTSSGTVLAKQVVVALGASVAKMFPQLPIELEKRQLFVLDLPITDERRDLPHTIVPLVGGFVYFFVKNIGGVPKFVLGQEDLIRHTDQPGAENYFEQLIARGLLKALPFLQEAQVADILWGFDVTHKQPRFDQPLANVFVVTCGSAVRSCIAIGQQTAQLLCLQKK